MSPRRRQSAAGARKPTTEEKKPGASVGGDDGAIAVRMYRVGFGDCFLVSLPVAGTERRHILVDCGVHSRGDIGSLGQVVADVVSVTGRRLAAVIATHAHQDHIAGFDRFGAEFERFHIGEVWLPWTWDPTDPTAVRLQRKHAAVAQGLAAHYAGLAPALSRRADVAAAAAAVSNLHGNAHAIAELRRGFGGGARVRFLKAGDTLADAAGVTGLSLKVLGPPQSETFLAQVDPPASQHYLRAAAAEAADIRQIKPFSKRWTLGKRELATLGARLSPGDTKELDDATDVSTEELAFSLDKARNNESLVTLLTYRGQSLLFPGDAQYGNWRWWLENEEPEQILPEINFLKVAHHGSVNATPKSALERMSDGRFAAMVSTQSTPWPSIPRVPLMQRLDEKTAQKIVRSDWLAVRGAPRPSRSTAPPQPTKLPPGFGEGDLWFDYVLPR